MLTSEEKTIYAGVSVFVSTDSTTYVAIAFRDATYLLDFIEHSFSDLATESNICSFIISELTSYRDTHMEKILGIGLPRKLHEKSVILCARLWTELDIVPVILDESGITDYANNAAVVHFRGKRLDEQADSGARKCIRYPPHSLNFIAVPHITLVSIMTCSSGFSAPITCRSCRLDFMGVLRLILVSTFGSLM